jgi:hypothetical protein
VASRNQELTEAENEMAEKFWGFGRWDAPFWFIGPEPGGSPDRVRLDKWQDVFHKAELCDCREFHRAINEERWHFKRPQPELQKTWRRLILFMQEIRGRSTKRESLREYQVEKFGCRDGDSCVIELSGLNAEGFASARIGRGDRLLERRAKALNERLNNTALTQPEVVLMYSYSREPYWRTVVGGRVLERFGAAGYGKTVFAYAPSPTSPEAGSDQQWIDLGSAVKRKLAQGWS